MKIIFFVNYDLEANLAIIKLSDFLQEHEVSIFYSKSVGDDTLKPDGLKRLEYYEKALFFEKAKDSSLPKTKVFGKGFALFPFHPTKPLRDSVFINELKSLKPDLFISIRFSKIFKGEILSIPKKGIINLHSAILPDYKGILGTLHAINNRDTQIGCTLHYIDDKTIDTGRIIRIEKLEVNRTKSLLWHIIQLYPLGSQMIQSAISALDKDQKIETIDQKNIKGNYFSLPKQEDFDKLKSLGISIASEEDYSEIF